MIIGDYFSKNFLDLKWIFLIGRIEYETVVPSSILYMGFFTILLRFDTGWDGNYVGQGGGWLDGR